MRILRKVVARRSTRFGWGAAITALVLTSCALPEFAEEAKPLHTVALTVADEHGEPLAGATVEVGAATSTTDGDGHTELRLDRPAVAVVSNAGFLDEPVAVGLSDTELEVRLWSRTGPDGATRTSVHFGGDVMLGRRFLDPDRSTPFVDDETSARRVVAELAPMAAAADTTIVNLETVIGDFAADAALPAKRYVIQSSPGRCTSSGSTSSPSGTTTRTTGAISAWRRRSGSSTQPTSITSVQRSSPTRRYAGS